MQAESEFRVIHPDYGDMTGEVYEEMKRMIQAEHEETMRHAERWQAEIAAATPGDAIIHDNFALKAQIHPRIVSYWRMREGRGFWKHELDNFLKKNPACRVKQRSANPTVRIGTTLAESRTAALRGAEPLTRGPVGKRGRWAL